MTDSGQEILSFVEGNPDYYPAIESILQELPDRVEDLQAAFDEQALSRLAVKLSLGQQDSDSLCPLMEMAGNQDDISRQVNDIFKELDSLIRMCLVTGFNPDSAAQTDK